MMDVGVATTVVRERFGVMPDGRGVDGFTLRSGAVEAKVIAYGARLQGVRVPDRAGVWGDVVLGFETLAPYLTETAYLGAVVGRYGNRIAGGRFCLDGVEYQVPVNNGVNALHGGPEGFDRRVWEAAEVAGGVEFTLRSEDGDQGFPGALRAGVRYTLEGETLRIAYTATTDKATVVNLTNHAYFNLAGEGSGSVLDHELMLAAPWFIPTDETLIPTGELSAVEGTAFDFRRRRRIEERIGEVNAQLVFAGGYDHTWVLEGEECGALHVAARLWERGSGRLLEVCTSEPGVQFYSGNFLNGTLPNRVGGVYERRSGLCLETQHFPDSPNQGHFPTTVLRAGETMRSTTTFRFSRDR